MELLRRIEQRVQSRAEQTAAARPDWPCRKGCDDCCRHLASAPRVSRPEWNAIAAALLALPAATAELVRRRIRESTSATRPVVCPLLDRDSGSCLVYAARPVACRAYGFYAEREFVLGCSRIESIAAAPNDVIWGNHAALEREMSELGEVASLGEWLAGTDPAIG